MKIRQIQVTMEPCCPITVANDSGMRTLTVEVRTECGQHFSTTQIIDEEDFQDTFGFMMRDAEFRIRKMVANLNPPKTSP